MTVLYDGATDASISEVEIVYCRISQSGVVKELFCALEDLKHAHADGVFAAIESAMEVNMEMPNWKEKLVGAGSDGAKVNIGSRNSVATRMQQDRPYVVIGHCVAHRLELGVLQATKQNEHLEVLQDMMKRIHKHYHFSPKALRELKEIADALEEKFLKPSRLQGTRWLPHISGALMIIAEKYSVLYSHFDHVSQSNSGTAEVRGRATWLANKLRDFRLLRFMHFMRDLFQIMATMSKSFQKVNISCVDFLDILETANLQLVVLRQGPGEILQGFLDNLEVDAETGECWFRGTRLTRYVQANHNDYEDLQAVIDHVSEAVNGRLENAADPTRSLFQDARIFDTRVWPNTRVELGVFGNAEIVRLAERFEAILTRKGCQRDALPREWIQLKAHVGAQFLDARNKPTLAATFGNPGNEERFGNIAKVFALIQTLPVSSSTCERGFSAVKRIKSDWRATLTTPMMNHLLMVVMEGPDIMDYNADIAIRAWWNVRRRPRWNRNDDEPPIEDPAEDELLQHFIQLGMAGGLAP